MADVSTPEGRETLIKEIEARFGGQLDVLVNNVGTNIRKPTVEFTEEDYDFIMRTNLQSMFELTKLCYPYLKRPADKPWDKAFSHDHPHVTSSVVNIGSVAGVTCIKSGTIYAMTSE